MHDKTFIYRLIFGLSVFILFGFLDYKKNPHNPKRLKEYFFLFFVTALVMLYAVMHDFITYSISKEYYSVGKDIQSASDGFNLDIIKLALMAGWTIGLIMGATLLIANNPGRLKRQLRYKKLFQLLFIPLANSILFAIILGTIFYLNPGFFAKVANLENIDSIFSNADTFIAVWGIHIGSYLGGLIGLVIAVFIIIKAKRKIYTITK